MDTIGFFTSEEKKLFFSKYRLLLRNLYSFLEREDIRKMKELMKRVVALDCYGRDKNGINGLLRNIDTALIATLEIGLKRTSVIALLLYRPVLKKAITIEEVEQKFGADVTLIIRRLLKTSDLYARNTAVNSENFHHLLFSFAEDVRVILLMIADRLCLWENRCKRMIVSGWLPRPLICTLPSPTGWAYIRSRASWKTFP